MARRQRADITDEQFERAITWLVDGGTKKGACEILGVGSNATMHKRIGEYEERKVVVARMRKQKRGTAIAGSELTNIAQDYLAGSGLQELAESYYRGSAPIRSKLEEVGALLRSNAKADPLNPSFLPDECIIASDFKEKELVWVPGYDCVGEIQKEVPAADSQEFKAYRVYLLNPDNHRYVNYYSYELGSLRHLVALGVDFTRIAGHMDKVEVHELLNVALRAARKQAKEMR